MLCDFRFAAESLHCFSTRSLNLAAAGMVPAATAGLNIYLRTVHIHAGMAQLPLLLWPLEPVEFC